MRETITLQKTIQPQPVRKIFCPTPSCKELMVKIYPWANLTINGRINPCNKCVNKNARK